MVTKLQWKLFFENSFVLIGSSWKSNETDSTPFLSQKSNNSPQPPQQIPNYLELLYDDSDCPPENDGYEIPNKPEWNKTQLTPPSTSSKAGDSVAAKSEVKSTNRDSGTFTEKQDSGLADECLRK